MRRIVAAGALLLAAAFVVFLVELFQPFHGKGGGRVTVTIPRGASTSRVGSILEHDGVVSSSLLFEIRVFLEGKRGDLHSGTFVLRHDMSYAAAIAALGHEAPLNVVRATVPEGYTRAQIAVLAREDGLSGSYLEASRPSRAFSPRAYGAPVRTSTLEGFLFPATYELRPGAPAARLVSEQLQAFRRHFGSAQERRARALRVTPYQLLTVASMIEREAELPRDRPLVAAVIYNRLRLDMPLGIDATIRYALEDYEQPLTESQLRINSPYNTRLHRGLPPTPISNPGMASIEAAAHPAHVGYLYYVNGADGCGELVFSSSYAQFERNAQAYQAALRRNGGRVPTCHH